MARAADMLSRTIMEGHTKMKHFSTVSVTAFAVAVLATSGCSKKDSDQAPPPPPSMTLPATTLPPSLPPLSTSIKTAAPPVSEVSTSAPATDEETPEQLAAKVKQLEADYQREADFQKRVGLIYELSSTDSSNVVDALGRLFLNEKDQELKIELINSLMDVDGQNDKKLAILSSALRGDQPKEVRLEAIDGRGDVEDKRGIQVLQLSASDPDEDVRDGVKDTIEQLETAAAQPPTPGQPPPTTP
jgi:type IV secretory pathway VirB10-like protein